MVFLFLPVLLFVLCELFCQVVVFFEEFVVVASLSCFISFRLVKLDLSLVVVKSVQKYLIVPSRSPGLHHLLQP